MCVFVSVLLFNYCNHSVSWHVRLCFSVCVCVFVCLCPKNSTLIRTVVRRASALDFTTTYTTLVFFAQRTEGPTT